MATKRLKGFSEALKEKEMPEELRGIMTQTEQEHKEEKLSEREEHIAQIKRLIPPTYRNARGSIETRSKRVVILTQDSIYGYLKRYAKEEATSVNEIINQILIQYIEDKEGNA